MSVFVRRPGLPDQAELLLIGEKYADILQKPLKNIGISAVFVPDNPAVDPRLSGHADLSVFHPGGEKIFLAPFLRGTAFQKRLEELGAGPVFAQIVQGPSYPQDAQLNARAVGDRLFYAPGITAPEIVSFFTNRRGATLIPIRQGYAGCAVCPVDGRSLITADRGIARAAEKAGFDVLLIAPGSVDLPGFPCGFIGGAAFRFSDRRVAFTGRLEAHPDKEAILAFLRERGFEAVFLTDRPIFDIGGAIALTEKA